MSTKRRPYKTYPKAFKLEAVKLMQESDKPASEVALQLGIRRNQLYKWKEQLMKKGDVSSGKKGRPKKEDQSELASLRQELILQGQVLQSCIFLKSPFVNSSEEHSWSHYYVALQDLTL